MTSHSVGGFIRSNVLGLTAIFIAPPARRWRASSRAAAVLVRGRASSPTRSSRSSRRGSRRLRRRRRRRRFRRADPPVVHWPVPIRTPSSGRLCGGLASSPAPSRRTPGSPSRRIVTPARLRSPGVSTWATASPPIRWRAAGWTPTPGPSRCRPEQTPIRLLPRCTA